MSDAPDYHIQINDRRGAIVISGPDPEWVASRAEWARNQLSAPGGTSVGFTIESGPSAMLERAEQMELPYYLGEGGPRV